MTDTSTDYKTAATKSFNALKGLYGTTPTPFSFWKLGNTFDTMLDYLDTMHVKSADDIGQMVLTQFDAALGNLGGFDAAWFDDFGWWTLATQRACQKPYFDKKIKDRLQKDILEQCWPRFGDNAPKVWERRGSSQFDSYAPAVEGGAWNAYWIGTPDKYKGPNNGDPSDGHLVGIQNTVTNALYLVAAYRLGAILQLEQEHKFLFTWFDQAEDPLWWKVGQTALVRERVGHFANNVRAAYGYCDCSTGGQCCYGYHPEWAWAGDQGLILGYLADAIVDTNRHREGFLERAKALLSGVCQRMVDGGKVVQPYTATGCIPDCDINDYQTGPGVFWRNALYAWNTTPELRPALTGTEFKAVLQASANAAAKSGDQSFDGLSNQTSVLVAATAMLT